MIYMFNVYKSIRVDANPSKQLIQTQNFNHTTMVPTFRQRWPFSEHYFRRIS